MDLNLEDRGTAAAASQQDEALTNGNAGMNDLMGLHGPSSTAKPQVLIDLPHFSSLCPAL